MKHSALWIHHYIKNVLLALLVFSLPSFALAAPVAEADKKAVDTLFKQAVTNKVKNLKRVELHPMINDDAGWATMDANIYITNPETGNARLWDVRVPMYRLKGKWQWFEHSDPFALHEVFRAYLKALEQGNDAAARAFYEKAPDKWLYSGKNEARRKECDAEREEKIQRVLNGNKSLIRGGSISHVDFNRTHIYAAGEGKIRGTIYYKSGQGAGFQEDWFWDQEQRRWTLKIFKGFSAGLSPCDDR